jgi:hypothetical protein
MRSTPIEEIEATPNMPPLKIRWECKALVQYVKA